jgi:hypothetical protein
MLIGVAWVLFHPLAMKNDEITSVVLGATMLPA